MSNKSEAWDFETIQSMAQELAGKDEIRRQFAGMNKDCVERILRIEAVFELEKKGQIQLTPKQRFKLEFMHDQEIKRGKAIFLWDIFSELGLSIGSKSMIEKDE